MWQRIKAWLRGHPWTACRLCGRHFANTPECGVYYENPGTGYVVCPDCTPRAQKHYADMQAKWRVRVHYVNPPGPGPHSYQIVRHEWMRDEGGDMVWPDVATAPRGP